MSSPRRSRLTEEDIDEALYGGDVFRPDSSSSSSDTNRTVRGGFVGGQSPVDVFNNPTIFSPPKCIQDRTIRLSPVNSPVLQTPLSSAESSQIPLSPISNNTGSLQKLSIHFKKPPGSASIRKGPFTLEKLQSYLGLRDDAVRVVSVSLLGFIDKFEPDEFATEVRR